MEAIQKLLGLFNSGYTVSVAVAAIVGVLFKIGTQLFKAMGWHDRYFVRKRLTRLKAIRSDANNSAITHYLDEAIDLEMFRIASGVNTSRSKMEYLLQLNQVGRWSPGQLRSLSKFLALDAGRDAPTLSVTLLDRLGAWVSGASALCAIALGVSNLIRCMLTGMPLIWLLGISLFGLTLIAGRFLATDLIDYLIVRRAQQYLGNDLAPAPDA